MKKKSTRTRPYYILQEDGQGLVEYGLILVLIVVVVIVALVLLGPTVGNMFSNVVEGVATSTPSP